MIQISKIEQTQVVGGLMSASTVTLKNPLICDLPLPVQPTKKIGGFVCVYPHRGPKALINVQNVDPSTITTGFGG